jgi:hypothetical protein
MPRSLQNLFGRARGAVIPRGVFRVNERVEKYRRYAEECLEMAARSDDETARTMLIVMAQAWHRLAQYKEAVPLSERS